MTKRKTNDANLARRSRTRFCIDLESRYTLLQGSRLGKHETGRILNISSGGVWWTTESILGVGLRVELSVNWPALINDVCPMKLVVYGRVVRSDAGGTALVIERHEFRTQGSAPLPLYSETALRLPM